MLNFKKNIEENVLRLQTFESSKASTETLGISGMRCRKKQRSNPSVAGKRGGSLGKERHSSARPARRVTLRQACASGKRGHVYRILLAGR